MIVLALLGVMALGGFFVLLTLEARNRGDVIVFVIFGLLILECAIFPHQGTVPAGLFRPTFGGFDMRLVDFMIPAAVLARLCVRGLPLRVTGLGLALFAFFAWYGFGFLIGIASGSSLELAVFQAKAIVHTGGMAILAAGVPVSRLTAPQPMRTFAKATAVAVLVIAAFGTVGLQVSAILPGSRLSLLGPDFATIAFSLGILCIVVEMAREERNTATMVACVVLLLAPIFARQRAAIIGAVACLVVLGFVMGSRRWQSLSPVRVSQAALLAGALILPMGFISVQSARSTKPVVPLAGSIQSTFGSTAKVQSADTRRELWKEARRLASQRPVLGWGLGRDFSVYQDTGRDEPFTGGDFHNVPFDVMVRSGTPGILFLAGLGGTVIYAIWVTWRRAQDLAGALTVACGIVLAGLATKSLFESTLQKFRLATLIGLCIGIIIAARRTVPDRFTETPEPAWS